MPFTRKMTEKFGKKEASSFGLIFSVIACALMIVLPITPEMNGVIAFILLQLLNGFCSSDARRSEVGV